MLNPSHNIWSTQIEIYNMTDWHIPRGASLRLLCYGLSHLCKQTITVNRGLIPLAPRLERGFDPLGDVTLSAASTCSGQLALAYSTQIVDAQQIVDSQFKLEHPPNALRPTRRVLRLTPTVFNQPRISSARFRLRWLTSYP